MDYLCIFMQYHKNISSSWGDILMLIQRNNLETRGNALLNTFSGSIHYQTRLSDIQLHVARMWSWVNMSEYSTGSKLEIISLFGWSRRSHVTRPIMTSQFTQPRYCKLYPHGTWNEIVNLFIPNQHPIHLYS